MNYLYKLVLAFSIGVLITPASLAGEFRVGGGISEVDWSGVDLTYTTFELGYDIDHIFGFTADYSKSQDYPDYVPQRANFLIEMGYEFGDDFTIRPYASVGLIHIFGDAYGVSVEGSTSGVVEVGLRAGYKFIYIDAGYRYNLKNTNDTISVDSNYEEIDYIWTWENHDSISLTAGFRF